MILLDRRGVEGRVEKFKVFCSSIRWLYLFIISNRWSFFSSVQWTTNTNSIRVGSSATGNWSDGLNKAKVRVSNFRIRPLPFHVLGMCFLRNGHLPTLYLTAISSPSLDYAECPFRDLCPVPSVLAVVMIWWTILAISVIYILVNFITLPTDNNATTCPAMMLCSLVNIQIIKVMS